MSSVKQILGVKKYLEEIDFLKSIRAKAETRKIPVIDDQTGSFLELAVNLLRPVNILEIGCGTGYSTYFLLKNLLPKLSAAEAACGQINTEKLQYSYTGIDLNVERLKEACSFIGGLINKTIEHGNDSCRKNTILEDRNSYYNIEFIHGNAIKIIPAIAKNYDLVFIDAAKYEYPCYLETVKGKLKDSCVIIADNIFYSGKIFSEEIAKHDLNSVAGLKGYISSVTGSDGFETSFFNIGDGLALSRFKKNP